MICEYTHERINLQTYKFIIISMKPIIKWVGGKTQILEEVFEKFPNIINNYHEIFLGGGSVLFELLDRIRDNKITLNGNIYCYDKNRVLIGMFNNIKNNHKDLYKEIGLLLNTYSNIDDGEPLNRKAIKSLKTLEELKKEIGRRGLSLSDSSTSTTMRNLLIEESDAALAVISAKKKRRSARLKAASSFENAIKSKESYYYWIRKKYNEIGDENLDSVECSAMFIFLNKTCFRGVYRVGPNGFNVPFGNYKKLNSIISFEELENMSNMIEKVNFNVSDFAEIIPDKIGIGDFVYLDPPYVPINNTSFVNYQSGGFNDSQHDSLFRKCHELKNRHIMFLMSNSDTKKVRDSFLVSDDYEIDIIKCRRAINSKKPDSVENEVLILQRLTF